MAYILNWVDFCFFFFFFFFFFFLNVFSVEWSNFGQTLVIGLEFINSIWFGKIRIFSKRKEKLSFWKTTNTSCVGYRGCVSTHTISQHPYYNLRLWEWHVHGEPTLATPQVSSKLITSIWFSILMATLARNSCVARVLKTVSLITFIRPQSAASICCHYRCIYRNANLLRWRRVHKFILTTN